MTRYSLAPGFVVFNYTSTYGTHRQVLPVIPFSTTYDPGDTVSVLGKGGATILLAAFADAWSDAIKGLFHTGVLFNSFDYWQKPTADSEPVYINSVSPSTGAGTNVTAPVKASMLTFTYRTTLGHRMKVVFMDTSVSPNNAYSPPLFGGDGTLQGIDVWLRGATDCIAARDGGYPQVAIRALSKTSDALRKRYNMV